MLPVTGLHRRGQATQFFLRTLQLFLADLDLQSFIKAAVAGGHLVTQFAGNLLQTVLLRIQGTNKALAQLFFRGTVAEGL